MIIRKRSRFIYVVIILAIVILSVMPLLIRLAGEETIKIMLLGDSITQGNRFNNSYRRALWHKLNEAEYQIDFVGSQKKNQWGAPPDRDFDVDHEGHWGWRADQILEHLDRWAVAYQPDIVLVHLGTNDMFQGNSINSTIDELGEIIDVFRRYNPNVTILLAQLIPSRGMISRIQALNMEIPGVVQAKDTSTSPVILVDMEEGFDVEADTYDGIHPNKSGEEKMANTWYAALKRVLEE